MATNAELPLVDISSPDSAAAAKSIRQACVDHGFFYLVNHGIEESFFRQVFKESSKFFSLPLDEKMKLGYKNHRGYTPMFSETLDPASEVKGDLKEGFYIGPAKFSDSQVDANQWPSDEVLPCWRATMEPYYEKMLKLERCINPWHLYDFCTIQVEILRLLTMMGD
ncbi:hypothetical protein J5N97_029743 [Dioscorea zingiberensis]|uniref:Non-haem dioxygenase N-terminal domain-containing protein n=1 Tax=Dioscorea zingiberensis TaxID=325984 RepID=A0A9D5BWJ4_9LILI|nr:hypothetical protein J5N97_029743 [Dioscorea zingiberensis]